MKAYNDLLSAADNGQLSALCLLDLTAAFDTVDHELLLSRLERQFGLRDSILQWFRSYLGDNHSVSCTGLVHLPSSSLCVQCPKAQSLARYCLFCTWLIS